MCLEGALSASAEAGRPRSQAALSLALRAARQRAAPSLTAPGTLPGGADAAAAASAALRLDWSGTDSWGMTRSSGRWAPGSLAFSAATTAGLRTGTAREAAVAGIGAEAGADAGAAAGWALAAPAATRPRRVAKTLRMGHPWRVRMPASLTPQPRRACRRPARPARRGLLFRRFRPCGVASRPAAPAGRPRPGPPPPARARPRPAPRPASSWAGADRGCRFPSCRR
jgi:hypothetical protein